MFHFESCNTAFNFRLSAIALLLCIYSLRAADSPTSFWHFSFEMGYTPTWIIGDDPAKRNIFKHDTSHFSSVYVTSSHFTGIQHGWQIQAFIELGSNRSILIPFGVQRTFYKGVETLGDDCDCPTSPWLASATMTNTVTTFNNGIHYNYTVAHNLFGGMVMEHYIGADALLSIVPGTHIDIDIIEKKTGQMIDSISQDTTIKLDVFRLGMGLKTGVLFRYEKFGINISASYNALNIAVRDAPIPPYRKNQRLELLTPTVIGENKEHIVTTLTLGIALHYSL